MPSIPFSITLFIYIWVQCITSLVLLDALGASITSCLSIHSYLSRFRSLRHDCLRRASVRSQRSTSLMKYRGSRMLSSGSALTICAPSVRSSGCKKKVNGLFWGVNRLLRLLIGCLEVLMGCLQSFSSGWTLIRLQEEDNGLAFSAKMPQAIRILLVVSGEEVR